MNASLSSAMMLIANSLLLKMPMLGGGMGGMIQYSLCIYRILMQKSHSERWGFFKI